ncbi:MAG: Maf family protein [Sphingomonas sp.]|nr:Maf family protein [Sphingomonas sp.]
MTLLLASRSATRRRMLADAGVRFALVDASLDEEAAKLDVMASSAADARMLAGKLAEAKALSAAAPADALVLGADQVLETEQGAVLSKAASRLELRDQLRRLAGKSHRLHSAASIVQNGTPVWSATESAKLVMRDFSDAFLEAYLDRNFESVRWNVGGYAIEGAGAQLFDRIEGSHFAILGLPLIPLLAFLRERSMIAA